MQRGGEVVLQPLGEDLHIGDAREDRGDAVDVGGHRFEDQIAQPGQNRQRHNGGDAEQRPGGEPATRTVGVPRPRRLTMPVSPPI